MGIKVCPKLLFNTSLKLKPVCFNFNLSISMRNPISAILKIAVTKNTEIAMHIIVK